MQAMHGAKVGSPSIFYFKSYLRKIYFWFEQLTVFHRCRMPSNFHCMMQDQSRRLVPTFVFCRIRL